MFQYLHLSSSRLSMEQKQYRSEVSLDQDMGDSLSFSGLLCVQQQTKSVEPHSIIKNNGLGSANFDPDFQFDSSSKHQLIKPVSYNNLSVLLPHYESSGYRVTSPKRSNGGAGKKDLKGGKRGEVEVRKKSVFKSIFEPCRVCHAVEPSAIKEQNPTAAKKHSSF